jgi:hypothetical protein
MKTTSIGVDWGKTIFHLVALGSVQSKIDS